MQPSRLLSIFLLAKRILQNHTEADKLTLRYANSIIWLFSRVFSEQIETLQISNLY